MTFQDCIDFVRQQPNGFVATAENGQPHVRPLTVWRADETGLYFFLPKFKPVFRQLRENARVEVAFHRPAVPTEPGTLLRVTGRFELLEDDETRQSLFETHPWAARLGDGRDNPMIAVFRISAGNFSFWTWANNPADHPARKVHFP